MTHTNLASADYFDTLAQAVQAEFSDRPILVRVALQQFSRALNNRYPGLNIDVLSASLNSPNWVAGAAGAAPRIDNYTTTPLLEVLIHAITASADLLFTADHYLSDGQNRRIALSMRDVEDLLRRLPQVMIAAMQQSLTDYWNESTVDGSRRWQ